MNTKKISVILMAVAFFIVAIVSGIDVLTIRDVNVTYALSEQTDANAIQSALDQTIGKNWLFLSEEEVKDTLKGNHYLEVLSVDKQFPNVINVQIKERREVYYTEYDGQTYVTDENGFVLKQGLPSGRQREKIQLFLGDGILLTKVNPGEYIKTDNDKLLSLVFEIAMSVNLTDCIESIYIERALGYEDEYDVVFKAYTGVELRILKVLQSGQEKATNAFKAYDEKLTDYQKFSGEILSLLTDDGKFMVNYNGVNVMTIEKQEG